MKVCKANLYIFVTLVEKPDLLIYCDTSTFESTITDMAIAAVIYISVSVLLVISAGIFFVKAIQSLIDKKQPSNYKRSEQVMFLRPHIQRSISYLQPTRRNHCYAGTTIC